MTGRRRTPRELAEACFAVARSTAHAGERQAAIGRGEAICRRHGLDLAGFDVPGRRRPTPRVRIRIVGGEAAGPAAGDFLRRAFADFERSLAEAAARAGAADGETPYDARRRNFEAETAAARERDRAREAARG